MTDPNPKCTLVFDIGKTHYKVTLLDQHGSKVFSRRGSNRSIDQQPYLHFDVEGIWDWLLDQMRQLSRDYAIEAISITTHGAAAALVDLDAQRLLLPVMDYEFDGFAIPRADYDAIAPSFAETLSPRLPAGLNLGRQIHSQLKLLNAGQRDRVTILPYPNYWAWRLSGVARWEVSSLGCHTDLWNPVEGGFSSLVERLGISDNFPERSAATLPVGVIRPDIAQSTGVPATCQIWPGMHDSNAGYAAYLAIPRAQRPSVISTGTWSIMLAANASFETLDPGRDHLANTDIFGNLLATARFMGGREFETICELTNCDIATHCDAGQIAQTIDEGSFALPCFAPGCGPLGNAKGKLIGPVTNGKALATLYCALMLDHMLDLIGAEGAVAIEGSFANNPILCGILAALRGDQRVQVAQGEGDVIDGCWRVTKPDGFAIPPSLIWVEPLKLPRLNEYRGRWHELVASHSKIE